MHLSAGIPKIGILIIAANLFIACVSARIPQTFDNPVIKDMYTADAAALVCKGRVYIHTGHDTAPKGHRAYIVDDWYVFSTTDFVEFQNHGPALKVADFKWTDGKACESQVIERNGKFFRYVSVDRLYYDDDGSIHFITPGHFP